MKSIRWISLAAFTVLFVVIAYSMADRRVAQAQQLPPKPDPLNCCERMAPGGNTIAGPGISTLAPGDLFYPLSSISVRNVCITIQNVAGSPVEVGNGTDRGWSIHTVAAGQTQTHCLDLRLGAGVATRCDGCMFWWRVDKY
jgi:hypothetical protein